MEGVYGGQFREKGRWCVLCGVWSTTVKYGGGKLRRRRLRGGARYAGFKGAQGAKGGVLI